MSTDRSTSSVVGGERKRKVHLQRDEGLTSIIQYLLSCWVYHRGSSLCLAQELWLKEKQQLMHTFRAYFPIVGAYIS